MKTILIADAGGTSTTWTVVRPEGKSTFKTEPFNAVHMPSSELHRIIESIGLHEVTGPDPKVRFYGAGCRGEASRRVHEELERSFGHNSDIEVSSDLLGAARALCGRTEGIACILGTGSNSCLYDGEKIVANTPSLGYILGDEGSGASIGRRFLGLLLKGHM
ncbi:MAG: ATPase, partial [Duncaniella sp.]|nr:ATPase [Duncaniella sp.]